ncbi:MAG: YceI family protein [Bacteroidetes bacterium]|nr:MAG: YceI family protein [Bacteroidota bacterium]
MLRKIMLGIALLTAFGLSHAHAQKYFTREGDIRFISDTPLEKIEGENTNATSVFDAETGRLEFAVLVKAFHFEKALMQEHFNENYMESSTYPKATFKGRIQNFDQVNLDADEPQKVTVTGDLTIHGVTRPVTTEAVLRKEGDNIRGRAVFTVAVADYGIEIAKIVRDKIAKEVEIHVDVLYQPFNR